MAQSRSARLVTLDRDPHAPDGATVAPRSARTRGVVRPLVPDRFFRDVVGGLRNGVIAITRGGDVAFVNDEAYRALGLTPSSDDVGRPLAELLGPCPELVRIVASAFELANPPNRAELRLRHTGTVIGYTLCHVTDANGVVTGATLLFKDLTRVEQREERERLRDRLATLGEMAAAIAHEVKNPLAGIQVMAGLLKRRVPDAESQQLLAGIIEEARMANGIVQEVLDFARPIGLEVAPVPLAAVIEPAISTARDLAGASGGAIEVEVDGPLPVVEGDAHQLRQLFTNLLTNAFEALNGHGAVRIRALECGWRPGDAPPRGAARRVTLEVSDNGPGIPETLRSRIFSPFFTTKARGSGLGLAIVRKIVDAHAGRIDVDTPPEGGTAFRLTLPLTHPDEEIDE